MLIKICGIRRLQDISYLNEFLPDYAGFVFAPSKRQVTAEQAAQLVSHLHPSIQRVGVFVNESVETIQQIASAVGLNVIQLHGDEASKQIRQLKRELAHCEIWKAVRVKDRAAVLEAAALPADRLLLDAYREGVYGGTGQTISWDLLEQISLPIPFFLAGGLSSENIEQAIRRVNPTGVDVSGGVETDGYKNRERIAEIIRIVRGESER